MSYYVYLVETKHAYTSHLINELSPFIYQGLQSLYADALGVKKGVEDLRIFQELLRAVPKWNKDIIENETKRIMRLSNDGPIIPDLIQAVIKSNIMVLTNTPPDKKDQIKIDNEISALDFVHKCYIEVARAMFNNPFLMSTKFTEFEIKQNEVKTMDIIHKAIKGAIRKMLPMDIILKTYIGPSFDTTSNADNQNMTDSDKVKNLLQAEKARTEINQIEKQSANQVERQSLPSTQPLQQGGQVNDDRLLNHVANQLRIASENSTRALLESVPQRNSQTIHVKRHEDSPVAIRTVSQNNAAEDTESINVFSHMDKANIEQVYGSEHKAQARRPNNFLAPYYKH